MCSSDLELTSLALPTGALRGVSSDDIAAVLEEASQEADSYLRARYAMPATSWGKDLTGAVCRIAAWRLLVRRGLDPESAAYQAVQDDAKASIAWLRDVAVGRAHLAVDTTAPSASQAPRVVTRTARGRWI